MPMDDSWEEIAYPNQPNRTSEWVHSTGVRVFVEQETVVVNGDEEDRFYPRIENPANSDVDMLSIGPDLPVSGSPFDSAGKAEQATNQWILSADMSVLAP